MPLPRVAAAGLLSLSTLGASACADGPEPSGVPVAAAPTTQPATTTTTVPATTGSTVATVVSAADTPGSASPIQPPDVPWPTEAWTTGPVPAGVNAAAVAAIVEEAFRADDTDAGKVDALLVVSGGRLVVEAYNGWAPEQPHPSWSMAKSITHALLGVLVAEGRIDPVGPAPVPEWAAPTDRRHDITVDDLLRMRSGLAWQEDYAGASDVIEMLFGAGRADRGSYAASKALGAEPGSTFAYSTGTSMILARIIADQVGYGDAGTAWARSVLFDPLGIGPVEHDLDGIGVMSGGSTIDMTAQDFARFGLLYLRGGRWEGRQILPETWVDDARRATVDAPDYGAHWWVDADRGAFFADGFAGQLLVVVPALDLVVVALADRSDGRSDAAAWALVDAFG